MTTAKTISNIVLDSGGTNELTIFTEQCEKSIVKTLVTITPPQSTANRSSGPKDTKIVDLLRMEIRFSVRGSIASADETKLENLMNLGTTFTMLWNGTSYDVNCDKLTMTNSANLEHDETAIMLTVIKGVNL